MNDFPGPWKERKALEDQEPKNNLREEVPLAEKTSGCGWKMAIGLVVLMFLAKCSGL